jgi:hypothetical protein
MSGVGAAKGRPVTDDRIIAVALLTEADLMGFGEGLRRVYPLEQITDFADLLAAIDEADRDARETNLTLPNKLPPIS